MRDIILAGETRCAAAQECFPVTTYKQSKDRWIAGNDLRITSRGRVVARVAVNEVPHYMDCVTGTLFTEAGDCLSSSQVRLGELTKNQREAVRRLMATTYSYSSGKSL